MARQQAAQRFEAPNTILQDVPLKGIFNADLIRLIGESFLSVLPAFDRQKSQRRASNGLLPLEFSQRGQHIGLALAEQLPEPFAKACPVLLWSLGPELL